MTPAHPSFRIEALRHSSLPGLRRVPTIRSMSRSTRFERWLLMLTSAATPLLDTLPRVGHFSIAWIWFTAIGAYVLLRRPRAFDRAWQQPVFLAAYCFIVVAVVMEMSHSSPDSRDLIRFVQTIGGAVIIASLCRDPRAMRSGLHGFLLLAGLLTTILFFTSYGSLRAVDVQGFEEASKLRGSVYRRDGGDDVLRDLNRVSFLCGLGALVAFGQ